MKSLIVALLTIMPVAAFASDASETGNNYYAPSNGAAAACKEGRSELFTVANANGDGVEKVWYTCRNGSFVPAAAPVAHASCKEGSVQVFIEYTNGGETAERVVKTCVNGIYQ